MESLVSHLSSPKGVARNLEQEEVGRWFPNFTFQVSSALLCVTPLRMPHPSGVSTTAEKPSPGHLAAALFLCLPQPMSHTMQCHGRNKKANKTENPGANTGKFESGLNAAL